MDKKQFDQIIEGGWAAVEALVLERQQEGPSLEFKTKEDASSPTASRSDKKNLGKTLSAFCNSQGGVLIWGVNAEKDEDAIDAAKELCPIINPEAFESRIQTLLSDILAPKTDGIEVASITDPHGNNGVVLIWVPHSTRRPHRSTQDHHYYKRSGDSSYRMEHFDLEDIFMSRQSANLELVWEAQAGGAINQNPLFYIRIGLKNTSTVSARFPYLKSEGHPIFHIDGYGLDGERSFGLPEARGQIVGNKLFSGGSDEIIHPSQTLWVCRYCFCYFRSDMRFAPKHGERGLGVVEAESDIDLIFSYGCEGKNQSETTIQVNLKAEFDKLTSG